MAQTMAQTAYYGVYVVLDNGEYWIIDAKGDGQYFGSHCPTTDDVVAYVENL